MRACDRCQPKLVQAVESINLEKEGTVIDLCEKCKKEVISFINKPEKRNILGLKRNSV